MQVSCAVVGAGPAGIAIGSALAERGVEHVVLERDNVASTWRTQRWDNFRLNTPDWMNSMLGDMEPGTFCARDDLVRRLDECAAGLPIRTQSPVEAIESRGSSFSLRTPAEEIVADTVVVASGLLNVPKLPAAAQHLPARVRQVHTAGFRSADALPPGGVLVVGCGQSGCQIAEDLALAGRRVYLSTCEVGRFNWDYRGRETFAWLDDVGFWRQWPSDLEDPALMRKPQPLVASGGRTLSLPLLASLGVTLMGRLTHASRTQLTFDDSARTNLAAGDAFWLRTKGLIDSYIVVNELDAPAPDEDEGGGDGRFATAATLDIAGDEIGAVIWCTGFTGDLTWADLPLLNADGSVRHDGSASVVPGLWFAGFPWLVQRRSGIFYGFPVDAAQTAEAVTRHLA